MRHTATIDEYITLSLTRCKKMGYFLPNTVQEGTISWRENGEVFAAIKLTTDTLNHVCTLHYCFNGKEIKETVRLRWRSSNLDKGANVWERARGFYYFVCPVTGRSCRNLYLIGGRFVSRFAFKHLYEKQTLSRHQRADIFRFLDAADKVERLERQPYRKRTYRGKPTPYARKLEHLNRQALAWYWNLQGQAESLS